MTAACETFDLECIRRNSFIRDVEWHAVISSTNDRGIRAARDGAAATPLLILAGSQTAGRGRGANRWWSAAGALTFSLVFDPYGDLAVRGSPPIGMELWPRVALTAGVALCDVLEHLAPHVRCGIKWPNDVLLDGRKISGILIEIPPHSPQGPRRLVLGMGVNVNNSLSGAPAELRSAAHSLCDALEATIDGTQLVLAWLDRFRDRLRELAVGDDQLPSRWKSLCELAGKTIELEAGSRRVHGLCRGIDSDGALLVETNAGREKLYAGAMVRVVGGENQG